MYQQYTERAARLGLHITPRHLTGENLEVHQAQALVFALRPTRMPGHWATAKSSRQHWLDQFTADTTPNQKLAA